MMTLGSLFSGIGGIELGLEWAGFGPVRFQVEMDPFCTSVLERHWPHAFRFSDVRNVGQHNLPRVDILCGGFPCQDISDAGRRAGIQGQRSGLWKEYARIIGEIQPRFVLIENVAALRWRGLETVLKDLSALGYDALWDCLPATSVGAPHRRDRIYLLAYPQCLRRSQDSQRHGHSDERLLTLRDLAEGLGGKAGQSPLGRVADGVSRGLHHAWPTSPGEATEEDLSSLIWDEAPYRGKRIHALGNAVVPQIVTAIGLGWIRPIFELL